MKPRTPSKNSPVYNTGSTKHVRQPVPADQRGPQNHQETTSESGIILLVDDDPMVRESLHDLLVAEGYFVIPAENGQQAVDLVNRSPVDLVLLDLNMPVM